MSIKKAQVVGFIVSSLLGTLLHFLFDWTGQWPPAGIISAVNESTWEHLKLLAVPMLLYGIYEFVSYGRRLENFVPVRLLSILLGMAVITAGYYTYTGIIGRDFMAANVIVFELGVLCAYLFSYRKLKSESYSDSAAGVWAYLGIAVLVAALIIFTYYPPEIQLFMDPQTGGYGIVN